MQIFRCRGRILPPTLTRYRAGALWLAVAVSRLQPQLIRQDLQQVRGLVGLPSVLPVAGSQVGHKRFGLVQQGGSQLIKLHLGLATSNQR